MEVLTRISDLLWGAPTVAALAALGVWLSSGCGFAQIRLLRAALTQSLRRMTRRSDGNGTSPFEAVCTALAGTVGTGNIAGVAVALSMGGPGAILWMWVSALLGMGVKYAEIALAVKYRVRRGDEYVGGPMYYISAGLGRRGEPLALLFAAAGTVAAIGIGSMTQVGAVLTLAGSGPVPVPAVGAALAVLVLVTCRNGASGRGRTAALVVPLMAGVYLFACAAVIFANITRLPAALASIFTGALLPRAALGGAAGFGVRRAMSWGFRRGLFSNEAGLGSSPIAHASCAGATPGEQAKMGIFEVFVDTLVICTVTALAILCSGVPFTPGVPAGAELATAALASLFGGPAATAFMAVSMTLFAFSSIVSWSLYGERCAGYLLGPRSAAPYRYVYALATFLSSLASYALVIRITDIANFLMMVPNVAALALLRGRVRQIVSEPPAPPGRSGASAGATPPPGANRAV